MNRPKSVVRVIREVAHTVNLSRLFVCASSGMFKIHYLRVFDDISASKCATGPARKSEVYPSPRRLEIEKKRTKAPITPIRPLPGDLAPLCAISTTATRGGDESHSRGG